VMYVVIESLESSKYQIIIGLPYATGLQVSCLQNVCLISNAAGASFDTHE
jgi:hypothetical protein